MNELRPVNYKGKVGRVWTYTCPYCNRLGPTTYSYYSGKRSTRKNAKSMLYSHLKECELNPAVPVVEV